MQDAFQVGVLGLAVKEHGELEVTGFPLNLLLELNRRLEGAFGEGGMEEGQMVDQDVVQQRQIILAEAGEVFLGVEVRLGREIGGGQGDSGGGAGGETRASVIIVVHFKIFLAVALPLVHLDQVNVVIDLDEPAGEERDGFEPFRLSMLDPFHVILGGRV